MIFDIPDAVVAALVVAGLGSGVSCVALIYTTWWQLHAHVKDCIGHREKEEFERYEQHTENKAALAETNKELKNLTKQVTQFMYDLRKRTPRT